MNKKYNMVILPICFILFMASSLMLTFFSKNLESKVRNNSLVPFNEIMHAPENYRILNFDNWTEGMSRSNLYAIENSDICVTQEDAIVVKEITDTLNRKKFTPILKEEFDINYDDSNNKVKFWLSISVDLEASKKTFILIIFLYIKI